MDFKSLRSFWNALEKKQQQQQQQKLRRSVVLKWFVPSL